MFFSSLPVSVFSVGRIQALIASGRSSDGCDFSNNCPSMQKVTITSVYWDAAFELPSSPFSAWCTVLGVSFSLTQGAEGHILLDCLAGWFTFGGRTAILKQCTRLAEVETPVIYIQCSVVVPQLHSILTFNFLCVCLCGLPLSQTKPKPWAVSSPINREEELAL